MQNSECKMQNVEYRIQNSELKKDEISLVLFYMRGSWSPNLLNIKLNSPKLIVTCEIEVSAAQEGAGCSVAGGNIKLANNPNAALVNLKKNIHPSCALILVRAIVAAGKAKNIFFAVNKV